MSFTEWRSKQTICIFLMTKCDCKVMTLTVVLPGCSGLARPGCVSHQADSGSGCQWRPRLRLRSQQPVASERPAETSDTHRAPGVTSGHCIVKRSEVFIAVDRTTGGISFLGNTWHRPGESRRARRLGSCWTAETDLRLLSLCACALALPPTRTEWPLWPELARPVWRAVACTDSDYPELKCRAGYTGVISPDLSYININNICARVTCAHAR